MVKELRVLPTCLGRGEAKEKKKKKIQEKVRP
jgi:hypothetical protein